MQLAYAARQVWSARRLRAELRVPQRARRSTVMHAVAGVLRRAGKVAAGAVPTALAARLGLPALAALVFLAVLVIGVACWVFGSDARADRVSRVLLAWRGDASCLVPGGIAAPGPPVRRPRRWPWPRRS